MEKRLTYSIHAVRRMFERGITVSDIRSALEAGEVIEIYPEDQPYPSRLVLGKVGPRSFHIVVATERKTMEGVIVTVYEPDPKLWNSDLRTRRKK